MIARLAGRIILLSGWRRALAAFLSGAFATLTQPPFDIFVAGFVSFPVLVWLIDGAIARTDAGPLRRLLLAAKVGWWFGFGYFVSGLWWIGTALLVDADQFAWALPLAVLGLPAFLALFYAFAAMIARLLWSDGLGRILAFAFGFALAEWLRTFIFTGFPWNLIGYAAMPVPLLMQSVAVIGLVGMSALAVFVFAAPALLTGGHFARTGIGLAIFLALAHVGFGAWTLSRAPAIVDENGPLAVRIVQPSIAQAMKWDNAERRAIFDKLVGLTEEAPAEGKPRPDVIVWPETAIPYILESTPQALAHIGDALQEGQVLLAGAVREEKGADGGEPRYYNSIYTIDDRGRIVSTADKVHLVPFGEYLPFESFLRGLGLQEVVEMPGGFTAGTTRHALAVKDGRSFLPLICYEAIFPDELGYEGAGASAIINVTNDAWYGDTPGPYQHFRQAQVRAVEQGLPLIRAANNGLSAIVDTYGRITGSLALDAVGVVDSYLPSPRDPFWGRPPGWIQTVLILLTLLAASVGLILYSRRRFH
ncbi:MULTISPECIES: apolipoprotein N-acyltransferase [Brucella]|uniref:Apolipoprotein N-acyltransferase n=6 Tax=Brucella TaxID=234 RepID=Q2YQS4_BRUA2|nr:MULTISPECIES: apolipoprotein N-acyltransferase [Brucella]ERM85114.1 apolipoprotein N-acyltransferase [Brucella abortus 82]ERT84238.1 apolipoprotein N-acyltransferase [Brucella abortus 90-12178]ERU10662.1 apolipoprotein N-acyltransferase [Brucella abortus 99-9971-135]EXU84189.1 apolipoprotein N-acyltransferase [Brucella melitensis 548]KFH21477.1 acyltransferase [Brucella abortus LMN1]KFH26026.1 acyltransferase [Brucella abortus LMN2]